MDIKEDARYPIIIPIISSITLLFTLLAKNKIIKSIILAPISAANIVEIYPPKPMLDADPPNVPTASIRSATPRFAPSLIPNIEGPAKGFLNNV